MAKNTGHTYEDEIRRLLEARRLLPEDLRGNDAGFAHKGKIFYIQVKNRTAPDYGAKKIIWSRTKGWHWNVEDEISAKFDQVGTIEQVNDFTPRKHSIPDAELTEADKQFDRRQFEKSISLAEDSSFIYDYYALNQCFYIQIQGKGFYYLKEDVAELGVPQLAPSLNFIRLRTKTHSSIPLYNYSFRAVIRARRKSIEASDFDLEQAVEKFPAIK